MYNVVDLVGRGHALPLSVGSWFNVSHLDNQDVAVEKILRRCFLHAHGEKYDSRSMKGMLLSYTRDGSLTGPV